MALNDLRVSRVGVIFDAMLFQFSGFEPVPILALVETAAHFLYADSWMRSSVRHG
jgi:hypothetical protein